MTKVFFQNSALSLVEKTIFTSKMEAMWIVPVTILSRDLE